MWFKISTADDHDCLPGRWQFVTVKQPRRKSHRSTRFCNDAGTHGDSPHCAADFVLRHGNDVVNVLPADTANLKLFGREIFAAMKPRAFFINVGRGETVDEAALVEALETRRIAGAGLDVFATEPLPATSPLWKMPNVFMAPHVGGLFEEYAQMAIPLIIRNVRAFLAGQSDQMINRIDRSRPAAAETKP